MISQHQCQNATILIVDDQMTNILLLESILQNAGYTKIRSTQGLNLKPGISGEMHWHSPDIWSLCNLYLLRKPYLGSGDYPHVILRSEATKNLAPQDLRSYRDEILRSLLVAQNDT